MIDRSLFEACAVLPGWNQNSRLEAWQNWQSMAMPTIRDEAWKYTNLARLEKIAFVRSPSTPSTLTLSDIPLTIPEDRFCFINGSFNPALSAPLNEDSYLLSQRAWPLVPNKLHTPRSYFERLNAAMLSDGLYLDIKSSTNRPIYLLLLQDKTVGSSQHHLRHRIKVHADVKCEIVIVDWGLADTTDLTTYLIDIELEEGAKLNCTHLKKAAMKGYHIRQTHAHLAKNSDFNHFNFDFGAKLSRNEISAHLNGEHAACQLNGLALARAQDHIDNQTQIIHLAPKTNSVEQYRGIIDDKACHVFHGRVLIDADAPDSIADQQNKNMLLTSTGQAYAEPQLEIYNQNVQCIHGATVGDIDEEALFYLRSRGLSDGIARQLLIFGFARNILESIEDKNLQNELALWIKTHLALDSELILELYEEHDHEDTL
jgi:Fe-S cluster assembly protein SufD